MKYKFLIKKEVRKDISRIVSYLLNRYDDTVAAEELLDKISTVAASICENITMAPLTKHGKLISYGVRQLRIDNLDLFYIIDEERKAIVILYVKFEKNEFVDED